MTLKQNYRFNDVLDVHKIFSIFQVNHPYCWWFRGQADSEWLLLPKAGRKEYFLPDDRDLCRFRVWREQAVAYCEKLPENDWECLAQAQHYGLATRLLDWTLNPLVAVYFACISQTNRDGAVYCHLPENFVVMEELPLNASVSGVGFVPRAITTRILNQKGVFTVHSPPNQTIEIKPYFFIKQMPNLLKLVIPKDLKHELVKHLNVYGINNTTLFPDLDGLSKQINCETEDITGHRK